MPDQPIAEYYADREELNRRNRYRPLVSGATSTLPEYEDTVPDPEVWDIEDVTLPTQERVKKRVWILSEDPAAIEARVRTQLADQLEKIADSEHQSFIGTPPEYPNERATRAIRRDAFRRAAEVVRRHTAGASSGTVRNPKENDHG